MYTTIVFAIVAVAATSLIGFFYLKRRVDKVEKRLDEKPSESEEIDKSALQDFGVKEETKEGDKVMMFGGCFRAEKGNGCIGCDIRKIKNTLGLSTWECMNAMKCSYFGRVGFQNIIYKSAPMEVPKNE